MGKGQKYFPPAKRGKLRAFLKGTGKKKAVMKSAAAMKMKRGDAPKTRAPQSAPYVRHGASTTKSRRDREQWARCLKDIVNRPLRTIINLLKKDGVLPEWHGVACPCCQRSTLGPLKDFGAKGGGWARVCKGRDCKRRVLPHAFHPIFRVGTGKSHAGLGGQAAILFCAVSGCTQTTVRYLLKKNHKLAESIYKSLYDARAKYARQEEKKIRFGEDVEWPGVEADEVDVARGEGPDATSRTKKPVAWEQWGGIVQRGDPKSLVLFRLRPGKTVRRAPGPGPIRKRDWAPLAKKWLKQRKVILHADGARSYKLRVDGVVHDWVVHMKKRVKAAGVCVWVGGWRRGRWPSLADADCGGALFCRRVNWLDHLTRGTMWALSESAQAKDSRPLCRPSQVNGKYAWAKPAFTKVRYHDIADNGCSNKKKRIWVKCGAQIIDRVWGGLRRHLGPNRKVNSRALANKVRSFQWCHWNKGEELWAQTGNMLTALFQQQHESPGISLLMTNLPALGMKSLRAHLEVEGADSEKIQQVFEKVRGHGSAVPMYQTALHPEKFQDDPPVLYSVGDLPLMPSEGCRKMKHAFAVVLNYQGDIDMAAVRGAMAANDYNGLPELLRPRTNWEALYTTQLALVPAGDGDGTDIIRYFLFSGPQPLVDVENRLPRENEVLYTLSWGKGADVKTPWKVLVHMVDRLGGAHFRNHLPPQEKGEKEKKKKCLPQDTIVSQYQFIKDNAPRGNFDCEQMMWIDFQLNDPQSPIHSWKEGKIKEVLSHIKDQGIQAKKITYHPIFIFDTGGEGVERAKRIVPTFKSHSCLMVGEPGEGKTPYLETLAFAMGDYYADKLGGRGLASFREGPDLDFFRAEEGTKHCPCVFDGGDLFEQRPKTLKAFLDVGQFQAMTRERWGAAKFVRGQARFAAENMYDETAAPTMDAWRGLCILSPAEAKQKRNQYFFDMLKRTFPKDMSKANVMALLKRSSAVVNTPNDAFERSAGLDSDVTRAPKVGHYITKAAGNILYDYIHNGAMRDAEEYNSLRDKQLRFMKALLDKGSVPLPLSVKEEQPPDGAEGGSSSSAAREPLPPLPKRICWARSFGSIPEVEIDLSSSPEEARGAAAAPSSQDLAAALADADNGDPLGLGGGMNADASATGVKAAKMGALTKAAGVKAVKMGALSKATGVKAAKMGALTKAAGVKAVKMGALSKAAPGFHVRMRFRPPPPK
ncbi:unnamed protein product, partial [Prorocentrum cordatum]